jgi:membrane-associated protease RseP (regulator of RpoE activity)
MLVVRRQEMARLERELSALCGAASPNRGYIGVNVAIGMVEEQSPGRVTLTSSYPVVTRVEPGSPAASAGIMAFDTVVSINKLDARGRTFERFVREPGEKLTVRLARGDARHDVTLTVAQKPPTFGGACMQYRSIVFAHPMGQSFASVRPAGVPARTNAGTRQGGSAAQAGERQPVRIQLSPDSMIQGATFFVIPPGAGATALFMSRGATGAIVAGAEVALINGGLKTIFAVDHGALVVSVAPRSPAEQAGILSGDVIVRAQGEEVTAIAVLQRAIQAARDRRSVTLDIVRARQPKPITLRW